MTHTTPTREAQAREVLTHALWPNGHTDDGRWIASLAHLNDDDSIPVGVAIRAMLAFASPLQGDREALEAAIHQAIVRWSNGDQSKPIKAMVADAILAIPTSSKTGSASPRDMIARSS